LRAKRAGDHFDGVRLLHLPRMHERAGGGFLTPFAPPPPLRASGSAK